MPLFKDLDATDLVILRAIVEQPEIRTREVEQKSYLSRTQVLRRLHRLELDGLIVKRNGTSKAYRYTLNPDVDIEQFANYLNANRDPVARASLKHNLARDTSDLRYSRRHDRTDRNHSEVTVFPRAIWGLFIAMKTLG